MKIKPLLGIGDLLILKMYILDNNITVNDIVISKKITRTYRLYSDNYINFLSKFIINLFGNVNLSYDDDYINLFILKEYTFSNTYIFNDYKFDNNYNNMYDDYIIIHTKARFDYCSSKFNNIIKKQLENFFLTFKSKYKIILLGEKKVENNIEAQIHNIISLYDGLIKLHNNNTVIDLTYDELYSGNDYNNFEKDLFIINFAKFNIGFGYGGPLNIAMAFSQNNVFYIDDLKHKCLETYKNINNNIYSDINEFINFITINC